LLPILYPERNEGSVGERLGPWSGAFFMPDSLTEIRSAYVGTARLVEGRALLARGDTVEGQKAIARALTALRTGAGSEHPTTISRISFRRVDRGTAEGRTILIGQPLTPRNPVVRQMPPANSAACYTDPR
jgi:hypothetical protein